MNLRKLSSLMVRRPSRLMREVNSNASMVQWSRANPASHTFHNRYEMYEYLNGEIVGDEPIDYIEFGVAQGDSIRRWASLNTQPRSRFYGFDSFEGLPDDWTGLRNVRKKGDFSSDGQLPDIVDDRVGFVKGWFQHSLLPFLDDFDVQSRLVIHHDADIYESTLYCLTQCDHLAIPGTILVFDEFYSSSHEYQAFIDYTRSYMRNYSVLAAVGRNPCEQIAIEMK